MSRGIAIAGAEALKRNALMKRIALAGLVVLAALIPAHAQRLTGAGATFPYPIYSKWFSEYAKSHPGISINYQPMGSGGGIRQVSAGLVDFAASDEPLTDYQDVYKRQAQKSQSCCIAWPPTKTAEPRLRAGFTLVPVMWMPSR